MASRKTVAKRSGGKRSHATKATTKKRAAKKATVKKSPKKKLAGRRMLLAPDSAQRLTFIGTVKSESATSIHLFLNDSEVSLRQDGDTSTGKKTLTVGETVSVEFRVTGFNGTDWSVQVDIDCPDGPVKILSQSGTIGKPNGLGFKKDAKVPPGGCSQN